MIIQGTISQPGMGFQLWEESCCTLREEYGGGIWNVLFIYSSILADPKPNLLVTSRIPLFSQRFLSPSKTL